MWTVNSLEKTLMLEKIEGRRRGQQRMRWHQRKRGWKASPIRWTRAQLHSCVWPFATPWTVAHQAPLAMEFSRQKYWSGLPFPSTGDIPDKLGQTLGDSREQGSLECCSPWDCKELDMTWWLNNKVRELSPQESCFCFVYKYLLKLRGVCSSVPWASIQLLINC